MYIIKYLNVTKSDKTYSPFSLELAVSAFALKKHTTCSEDLSFFLCCPERHLD